MRNRTENGVARLERLYRERFHAFLRTTTAICGDPEAGRDALQDGFASAMRSLGGYRDEGNFEAWVWRIVINQAKKQRRRRVAPIHAEPTTIGDQDDAISDVREAIAGLPERQRHILFLRYYADLDYSAIAEALDIAQGTVGAALNQAHASLRRQFREVRK